MICYFCKDPIERTTSNWQIKTKNNDGETEVQGLCSEQCYLKHRDNGFYDWFNCPVCGELQDTSIRNNNTPRFSRQQRADWGISAGYVDTCPVCVETVHIFCAYCGKSSRLGRKDANGTVVWNELPECNCRMRCPKCKTAVRQGQLFPDDEGCMFCVPLIPLNNHDYKPSKFSLLKARNDKTAALFMGIELEIHIGRDRTDAVDVIRTLVGRTEKFTNAGYFVHDGSISPGFEIVSQPMTLEVWKNENNPIWGAVARLKELLHEPTLEAHPSCGLHIHITKASFTRNQVRRMLEFVYNNPRFMILLSARDFNKVRGNGGRSYCRFDPENKDEKSEMLSNNDKYTIVNFRNADTIEFRCFKSKLSVAHITTCLEFCYAMWEWTSQIEDDEAWDIQKFSRFVANKDRYSELNSFFSRHSF